MDVLRHDAPADALDSSFFDEATDEFRVPPDPMDAENFESADKRTERFDPIEAIADLASGHSTLVSTGIDLADLHLSPIELFFLCKLQQSDDLGELKRLTGLKQVELSVVLLNLVRAGALKTLSKASAWSSSGAADWRVDTEQQRRIDAEQEFARYELSLESGDVHAASLHLKRSLALHAKEATVEALRRHMNTFVTACNRFYEQSRRLVAQRRASEAVEVLEAALREFPGEAGFHNLLSMAVLQASGDTNRAHALLNRAVKLDPLNKTYAANLRRLDINRRSHRPEDL